MGNGAMTILLIDPTNRHDMAVGVYTPQHALVDRIPQQRWDAIPSRDETDSSASLVAQWQATLARVGQSIEHLTGVMMVAGPGALTPIRMSATAVMGIQLVHGIEIQWVPTDVAMGVGQGPGVVWVLSQGRRDEVVVGVLRIHFNRVERLIDPIPMSPTNWVKRRQTLTPTTRVVWEMEAANRHSELVAPSDERCDGVMRLTHFLGWLQQGKWMQTSAAISYVYPEV